jgi:superfamily II DNA or RNA helicase
MDLDGFRPGQREAYDTILRRFEEGAQYTSIVLPTRYGKSDLIRLAALIAQTNGTICQSFVLSPGATLRQQIVHSNQIRGMIRRYNLDVDAASFCREISKAEYNPGCNGEYLLSATIQLAQRNLDWWAHLLDNRKVMTQGLPCAVFIDEGHCLSNRNEWGKVAECAVGAGAFVVLLTATPVREDGQLIPGFRCTCEGAEECRRWQYRPDPDQPERWYWLDLYKGIESLYLLDADHETTFKTAWAEDPPPLCHLTREKIEVDLEELRAELRQPCKLSELTESKTRELLGKLTRDEKVIREAMQKLVRQLGRDRGRMPEVAAIVYTGHDQDPENEANEHARLVKMIFEDEAAKCGVFYHAIIATAASEETPSEALSTFAEGRGDVLIVKNAGGAGFDCPRLKIAVDLSSVRTVAATIQRLMRIATPYKKCRVGTAITLDDILMTAVWDSIIEESGGGWHRSEWEFVSSERREKDDRPDPRSHYGVDRAYVASIDDTLGNIGTDEDYEKVESWLVEFPQLQDTLTKPEIAEKIRRIEEGRTVRQVETVGDRMKRMQKTINEMMKEVIRHRMRSYEYSKERWEAMSISCYRELRDACKIPKQLTKIDQVNDLKLLERLEAYAKLMLAEKTPQALSG